ncbi:hypothetical protein PV518_45270 [Streptomyces sp. ND04-05B]|uniref:hypothetical protein n=1 Tax=Streptomyces sp. ND04-05B TaxID=3028693 RepID=UPI0029A0971C|nr:hypothetical protein [Streptomyces sp. ND04-05B]MDX3069269.1 hypothetical protein [Streptomyces sp. ND04-05B]
MDEQDEHKKGAVPNAFGNALAWKWTRQMPRGLKGGFLTMLYALRAMAAPSGELRFADGKPIRIQDLAKAAGCREHDARRYLDAGIRAGVVLVDGERRRGKPTRYSISSANPWPDWKAADDYLKATARRRTQDDDSGGSSGRSGTNSGDASSDHGGPNQIGPQRHELGAEGGESVRSTEARMGSVHSGPTGSGHGGPNNPCSSHGVSQEMADVVPQPQVVGGSSAKNDQSSNQDDDQDEQPFGRCEVCRTPLVRAGLKRCSAHREAPARRRPREGRSKPVQGPLLMPVPSAPSKPHEDVSATFRPPKPDPLAPLRTCGCGREFRDRDPGARCPDCLYAEHAEAARLRRVGT